MTKVRTKITQLKGKAAKGLVEEYLADFKDGASTVDFEIEIVNVKSALIKRLKDVSKFPDTPRSLKIEAAADAKVLEDLLDVLFITPNDKAAFNDGAQAIKKIVFFASDHVDDEGEKLIEKTLKKGHVLVAMLHLLGITADKAPDAPKIEAKHRMGGWLTDNLLKSNKPQASLFDGLLQDTKNSIESSGVSVDLVNRKGEGIKLSKGELKLILCLSKILHDKSETTNTKSENYYNGNTGLQNTTTFKTPQGEIELKSPRLSFTLYEVAKEFYGGENIGGENVRQVSELLYGLAEHADKKALIRYTRTVDIGKGVKREHFIEGYHSLISVATVGFKDMLNGKEIDSKKEIVINLHPVFADQIQSKYVITPAVSAVIQAYGSANVSEITQLFILEAVRAHSNKKLLQKDEEGNPVYVIGQTNLLWKLAPNYMDAEKNRVKPNRKQTVQIYMDKSIETAKLIGIISKCELLPGAGDLNYNFTLSKDW